MPYFVDYNFVVLSDSDPDSSNSDFLSKECFGLY